jgi:hypothetical protein
METINYRFHPVNSFKKKKNQEIETGLFILLNSPCKFQGCGMGLIVSACNCARQLRQCQCEKKGEEFCCGHLIQYFFIVISHPSPSPHPQHSNICSILSGRKGSCPGGIK